MSGSGVTRTVSLINRVAVSPLIGVSAVGARKYFKAHTDGEKARLQGFANPMFWVPPFLLAAA